MEAGNHLGTPTAMYDAEGAEVWAGELDTYGELRGVRGERAVCPFRWPGQYEDAETELYYNRFRYYDPEAAEYTAQDPLRITGGRALYAYVPDPIRWTDPYGLSREQMLAAALEVLEQHDTQIREVFGDNVETGIRGSMSTGTRYGASQRAGRPVPFDPTNFDVDAFVVDPTIDTRRVNPTEARYPGLTRLRESIESALRRLPGFEGMHNDGGLFNFAIWRERQSGSTMAGKGCK